MSRLSRYVLPLVLMASLPLAAAPATTQLLHSQFLPADDLQLRTETPEQQQLMLVTSYSVVVGSQRQSNQQPIPVTSPLFVRLKGKPMSQGATVREVLISFDGESKSLKKPAFDSTTRTLTLSYPMSVDRLQWEHIQRVLGEHEGNISATARALGMHRRTLQRKLQKRPVRR